MGIYEGRNECELSNQRFAHIPGMDESADVPWMQAGLDSPSKATKDRRGRGDMSDSHQDLRCFTIYLVIIRPVFVLSILFCRALCSIPQLPCILVQTLREPQCVVQTLDVVFNRANFWIMGL